MNYTSIIRSINRSARKHYHHDIADYDHNSYLEECFGYLIEFFREQLKESYLFSALSFKRNNDRDVAFVKIKKPTPIEGGEQELNYHFEDDIKSEFEPLIDKLLKDVRSVECMSLTLTLLKNPTSGKDLYFYSKGEYGEPVNPDSPDDDVKITFYNLSKLKLDSETTSLTNFLADEENESAIKRFIRELPVHEEYEFEKIGRLLWHYKQLERSYSEKKPQKDFVVHFMRPSFIDFDFNILLSLATNALIDPPLLSFINLLLYRIVSQTAIEKTKEVERLKRKTSYSLTSHSFKTELSTTIIPQVKLVSRTLNELNLPPHPMLSEYMDELLEESEELFRLTGLISLIDKVDRRDDFIESGRKDELICPVRETMRISDYCPIYNRRHPNLDDIVLRGDVDSSISIKVFDEFLSGLMTRLFYKTLFENLIHHAKRTNNEVYLTVSQTHNGWTFENDTRTKSFRLDGTKLTGNLSLFKTLIEETKSGRLRLESANHKFKVIYEPGE